MAAATLMLGLAACNNEATTSENGGAGGATSAEAAASGGIAGSYTIDMDAVRASMREEMEAELEGMSETERQMAEGMMMMMEGMVAMFDGFKLEMNADNTFTMAFGEMGAVEGNWTQSGDEVTLTPTRTNESGEWKDAEGPDAESITGTWDASAQTLTLDDDDMELVFKKSS